MEPDYSAILNSFNNTQPTTVPSPFPTSPEPTQGPLVSTAPPAETWLSRLFGRDKNGQSTIGGIPMNNLAAILGQLATAVGPKDSLGSKLGSFATSLGQAKLQELAAQQQHKHLSTMLSTLFADPSKTKSLVNGSDSMGSGLGTEHLLNQTPASFYGVDETKVPLTTRT